MCGIVCAIAERDVIPILLEGLKKLEYRGYDSAGLAVIEKKQIQRIRTRGKVEKLKTACFESKIKGLIGVAHTRWATHGIPSEKNAHPHLGGQRVVLVHNGILENYKELKEAFKKRNITISSDTDSEIAAILLNEQLAAGKNLKEAMEIILPQLKGTYSLCVMDVQQPDKLYVARFHSPLIIGLGIGENFVASDSLALHPVSEQFIFLEDGDIAEITRKKIVIWDKNFKEVTRKVHKKDIQYNTNAASKGTYRHFMLKEINEQPQAINRLMAYWKKEQISKYLRPILKDVKRIKIIACGTSYHAGLVGKNWIEQFVKIPCEVEIASEFRYSARIDNLKSLIIPISQSGETADTLAAIRSLRSTEVSHILAICNVSESSLVRATEYSILTQAGPEIGVAATKGFTTQLLALWLLTCALCEHKNLQQPMTAKDNYWDLLPEWMEACLALNIEIKNIAEKFVSKKSALFLGRGIMYPIALEGALKLKEISYIHAEGYPAGELKHGPLALVDKHMPVVVTAPNDYLIDKLFSNIEEIRARKGELIVFSDKVSIFPQANNITCVEMPQFPIVWNAILYSLPLQMLAYFVAMAKGTDIDQPRNLAKSVTVE